MQLIRVIKAGKTVNTSKDTGHIYRSTLVHAANHSTLGLKWLFSGDKYFIYLLDTDFLFGGCSAPGFFPRIMQFMKGIMSRKWFSVVIYSTFCIPCGGGYFWRVPIGLWYPLCTPPKLRLKTFVIGWTRPEAATRGVL